MWAKIQTASARAPRRCPRVAAVRWRSVSSSSPAGCTPTSLDHAHLKEDELDEEAVGALLNAQVFINTNCAPTRTACEPPPARAMPSLRSPSPPPFSHYKNERAANGEGHANAVAARPPRADLSPACPRRSRSPNRSPAALTPVF